MAGFATGVTGVGITGISAGRGWVSPSDVPALQALEGYELRAVSTAHRRSANLRTIVGGHVLDTVCSRLGEFGSVASVLDTRCPALTIRESGEPIVKTAPDQVVLAGRPVGGITASFHLREGVMGGTA